MIKPSSIESKRRLNTPWPLVDAFELWLRTTVETLSRKSDTTATRAAILYALNHWEALTRYVDDGRIEIDNSAAELALRGGGGRSAAAMICSPGPIRVANAPPPCTR